MWVDWTNWRLLPALGKVIYNTVFYKNESLCPESINLRPAAVDWQLLLQGLCETQASACSSQPNQPHKSACAPREGTWWILHCDDRNMHLQIKSLWNVDSPKGIL